MKQHLLLLSLFTQLAVLPASAQTALLIARSNIYLPGSGIATSGDSTVYSYNSLHQTIQYKKWKFENNNWELFFRRTNITYNDHGQILSYLEQYGNDVSGWTNYERYFYTYDADGNELSQRCQKWNGSSWFNLWLFTRDWVFNANGQAISQTTPNGRVLYTYNAFDSLESTVYQTIDNGNWVNYSRIDYAYTPNDSKLMSTTSMYWFDNEWVLDSRESYAYDALGNLEQNLSEDWIDGAWVNDYMSTYAYDTGNNLVYSLVSDWDTAAWQGLFQTFYAHDANSNELSTYTEIWSDAGWMAYSITNNYYSEFVSTQNPLSLDFQMFPNPASATLALRGEGLSQVQVVDVQGRSVLSQGLNGQVQASLEVGHLPAGAYFLQVTDKDGQTGIKPLQIRH